MSGYHYTTSVYFKDSKAYKRVELALNIPGAIVRPPRYDFSEFLSKRHMLSFDWNNYGEFVSEHYLIALDSEKALINFREPDLDYIASIVNPILDAFFQPHGAYIVSHNETDDVIYNCYDLVNNIEADNNKEADEE